MKRKVVLTETKLRKVVKNIITEILVNKAYNKFYSDIPEDIYKQIASVDNTRGKHLGPYARWIIEIYRNGNFDLNDINKTKKYISVFERMSKAGKLKGVNINTFNSLDDMYNSIKDYLGKDTITKGEKIRKNKDKGIERIYEDSEWFVLSLLTFEASLLYGANTKWCTASKDDPDEFKKYIDQGPLYVLINKKTKEKYQFHFESGFFVNELDKGISVPSLELPDGLVNAITKGDLKKENYFKYDFVGKFINGFAEVWVKSKGVNFINQDSEIVSEQWFNEAYKYKEGVHVVWVDTKGFNFINQDIEIMFPNQWFDRLKELESGFKVWVDDRGYNFINSNIEMASEEWFSKIGDFKDGFAEVQSDDKGSNFINQNGEIIFKQWFTWLISLKNGIARVELRDKEYELDLNNRTFNKI